MDEQMDFLSSAKILQGSDPEEPTMFWIHSGVMGGDS